jgi:hypothetical protein
MVRSRKYKFYSLIHYTRGELANHYTTDAFPHNNGDSWYLYQVTVYLCKLEIQDTTSANLGWLCSSLTYYLCATDNEFSEGLRSFQNHSTWASWTERIEPYDNSSSYLVRGGGGCQWVPRVWKMPRPLKDNLKQLQMSNNSLLGMVGGWLQGRTIRPYPYPRFHLTT